jgi:hypothetical protein
LETGQSGNFHESGNSWNKETASMKHRHSSLRCGVIAASLLLALCLVGAAMPWATAQADQPERLSSS